MRTYQNGTKEKKKLSKKMVYIILLSLSIVAIATIITLSLTLGNKPPVNNDPTIPSGNDPVVPKVVYTVPMDSFTVGMPASLTQVVYMSSMNNWRTHNGIDLIAEKGTAVYSISDGTVTGIKHTTLESSVITIEHTGGVVSYYKGLAKDVAVKVGDTVKGGDLIGNVAESMPLERDVGAHLHLEIKKDGKLVDPINYLPELADK